MKVIIPMAGRGTRLRPHTLLIPKPLLKLCGKTIIEWIVDEINSSISTKVDEIHFIIGDFGKETESMLLKIAHNSGCKGYIHYQREPLGTAHALYCAIEALQGEVFVAFADTIFKGRIQIDNSVDSIIWTMYVENPEKYGVVKKDDKNIIGGFVEKPKSYVSNNAIVGLYYFKEAEKLGFEINDLVVNNRRENNEFQLTNCLETLRLKGNVLKCAELEEWLDCGNKMEMLATNQRLVQLSGYDNFIEVNSTVKNSDISNGSSISSGAIIENSKLNNCIVYENAKVLNSELKDSIIGPYASVNGLNGKIFLGDYSEYEKI